MTKAADLTQATPATLAMLKDALLSKDLTEEQRKVARGLAKKLLSAMEIESPYVYVEKDGKRFYTLSAKRGAVHIALVVTTDIPK